MKIWEVDKLPLFLIFFIPGFISLKIYDLIVPIERRDFSKSVFEAIGYSSINFALLSWLIVLAHTEGVFLSRAGWYFLSLFVILFVFPVLWPLLFIRMSQWRLIARWIIHPIQKPWDWIFRKHEAYWIIVHLTDGRKVGGRYDTNSFASSYPSEEQIFIEEAWHLDNDGRFIRPVERSKGLIILGKTISIIEFFGP